MVTTNLDLSALMRGHFSRDHLTVSLLHFFDLPLGIGHCYWSLLIGHCYCHCLTLILSLLLSLLLVIVSKYGWHCIVSTLMCSHFSQYQLTESIYVWAMIISFPKPHKMYRVFFSLGLPQKFQVQKSWSRLVVSRTIYVNVDSPNLGFPYFNFLGEAQWEKNTLYNQFDTWAQIVQCSKFKVQSCLIGASGCSSRTEFCKLGPCRLPQHIDQMKF